MRATGLFSTAAQRRRFNGRDHVFVLFCPAEHFGPPLPKDHWRDGQ
jgi:hypothetical protein